MLFKDLSKTTARSASIRSLDPYSVESCRQVESLPFQGLAFGAPPGGCWVFFRLLAWRPLFLLGVLLRSLTLGLPFWHMFRDSEEIVWAHKPMFSMSSRSLRCGAAV